MGKQKRDVPHVIFFNLGIKVVFRFNLHVCLGDIYDCVGQISGSSMHPLIFSKNQ